MLDSAEGQKVLKQVRWVVVALGVFLAAQAAGAVMGLRYIGTGVMPANTISVSGEGEAFIVPDMGEFSFSVVSEKPTVAAAQADATRKINAITAHLKEAGVEEKDIKTTAYNVYPQYDYETQVCPAGSYCPGGRQVLRGYEVRQSTQVRVRDTEKAGELLSGVGGKEATEVSGLSFTVEDETAIQNEVRDEAIADAKKKAKALAKELGVSLVRIVSFSENNGSPYPYYEKAQLGMGGGSDAAAPAPRISTGENKYASNVTIIYEIR